MIASRTDGFVTFQIRAVLTTIRESTKSSRVRAKELLLCSGELRVEGSLLLSW
jgi:hypothetical protein